MSCVPPRHLVRTTSGLCPSRSAPQQHVSTSPCEVLQEARGTVTASVVRVRRRLLVHQSLQCRALTATVSKVRIHAPAGCEEEAGLDVTRRGTLRACMEVLELCPICIVCTAATAHHCFFLWHRSGVYSF